MDSQTTENRQRELEAVAARSGCLVAHEQGLPREALELFSFLALGARAWRCNDRAAHMIAVAQRMAAERRGGVLLLSGSDAKIGVAKTR